MVGWWLIVISNSDTMCDTTVYWLVLAYEFVQYLCTFKDHVANCKLYISSFSVAYIWLVIKMKGTDFLGFNQTCPFLYLSNLTVSSVNNLIRLDTVVMLSKSVTFFSNMIHCEITNTVFLIISIGNYICYIITFRLM